jgi:hypothetical protein
VRFRGITSTLAVAIAGAGLLVLYRFDPVTTRGFPQCVFHALTGLQCPGCGTTRALHALLHGNVPAAWHFNAALFVVAPFVVTAHVWPEFRTHRATAWAAVAFTMAWWVGRNVF